MLIHSNANPVAVASVVKRLMAQKHPEVITVAGNFQLDPRWDDARKGDGDAIRIFWRVSGAAGDGRTLWCDLLPGCVKRRPEIGIRIALGAARWRVVGMIMNDAWRLLLIGIVIGIVLSLIAGRGATSLLFGMKPYDMLNFAIASSLLVVIAALASFLPARRASRLDPMIALRYQ